MGKVWVGGGGDVNVAAMPSYLQMGIVHGSVRPWKVALNFNM